MASDGSATLVLCGLEPGTKYLLRSRAGILEDDNVVVRFCCSHVLKMSSVCSWHAACAFVMCSCSLECAGCYDRSEGEHHLGHGP